MTEHWERITKIFTSKRALVEFIHFLDVDEMLVEHSEGLWRVSYNMNKTTLTLTEDQFSEVDTDT